MRRVGVYVPGGKAVYPSSVLMNIIPAKVAGVEQIIMTTPPGADGKVNPVTLDGGQRGRRATTSIRWAALRRSLRLAFGTESIPEGGQDCGPRKYLCGPCQKRLCYGYVSIDSIAGPSEILVLADETANPRYVAADLLSPGGA